MVWMSLVGLWGGLVAVSVVIVLIARARRWCNCAVCKSYLRSSWKEEFSNYCDWYAHLLRQSPTGMFQIHVIGLVVVGSPATVEHVLKTRFHVYQKGPKFAELLGDLLGDGIFNVDGDAWRRQRKMASFHFGSVSLRSYALGIVHREIQSSLLPLLDSVAAADEAVDLQDAFRRFAFDAIAKISFGVDLSRFDGPHVSASEFAAAFDTASHLSALRGHSAPAVWKLKRFLNMGSEKELRSALQKIQRLAAALIDERREKLGLCAAVESDLLSRFMAAADVTEDDDDSRKTAASDKLLRDIVVNFMLAGRDTIAAALSAFFFHMSRHPAALAGVMKELASSDGTADRPVLPTATMPYVTAAIYESLRLLPPVQADSKFAAEDDVLPDGTVVRKGMRVMYHPYGMARMESNWGPECCEFRPERWLGDDGTFVLPESYYKYSVFQAGPRTCLGRELAVKEIKAVVVSVLSRFHVDVLTEGEPIFHLGLTASFAGGLPAKIRRRTTQKSI